MIYSVRRELEFEEEFKALLDKYVVDNKYVLDYIEQTGTLSSYSETANDDATKLYDALRTLVDAIDEDDANYEVACDIVVDYKEYA